MFKGLKMLGAAAAAAVLMAVPAQAATVIDFQTGLGRRGRTITWDGTTHDRFEHSNRRGDD